MVWHLVHTTVAGSPKMALLYSTDYGENFTQLYAFDLPASDHDRRCDIWKPADENEIYGIFGDQMIRIATDGSTLALGTVGREIQVFTPFMYVFGTVPIILCIVLPMVGKTGEIGLYSPMDYIRRFRFIHL
jgi:hypothetical protein